MRAKLLPLMVAAALTGMSGSTAIADDGVKTIKSMSKNTHLTVEPFEGTTIAEAEHAFIDMMKFYVPAQAASGVVEPIEYYNADEQLVEELAVAKPLIGVFIYGPTVPVADYPFAHSFMDAFGAVSLDDGETWKAVNLSESADLSSFTLDTSNQNDGNDGGQSSVDSVGDVGTGGGNAGGPGAGNQSNLLLAGNGDGSHIHTPGTGLLLNRAGGANGGQAALGGGQSGSGFGVAMRAKWPVKGLEDGDGYGPGDGDGNQGDGPEDGTGYGPNDGTGLLAISGLGNGSGTGTGDGTCDGSGDGTCDGSGSGNNGNGSGDGTCDGSGDGSGDGTCDGSGSLSVTNLGTGNGTGTGAGNGTGNGSGIGNGAGIGNGNGTGNGNEPGSGIGLNLLANAGGHGQGGGGGGNGPNSDSGNGDGTAGGGGAYGGPQDDDDDDDDDDDEHEVDLTEYPGGVSNIFHASAGNMVLVGWPSRFCRQGQPAYAMDDATKDAVGNYIQQFEPGFTWGDDADDLYLEDIFGVAGSQGSQDFADEGYPAAGEVPYRCVWTARGILRPGDDPRTTETEASHMVWTKAERLTSGRRDPNRIEISGAKGAGFVMTWQEDPDGLRPGQGLGPGEGWSGAVAHDKTDIWYSFIPYEYFDVVDDGSGNPINIMDYDLNVAGRPQVFVPMAVPMRLTNNDKCNFPEEGVNADDPYCDIELAEVFGLKDQCADAITITTGNPKAGNESEGTICVADSDGDGIADLPNVANTASTRARTKLMGYDSDNDGLVDSGWVVSAAEESKGLGKFFFEADSNMDGIAEPCLEETDTCTAEIGKNQWYFSFDMGSADTSATMYEPNGLVQALVSQGNMINQPEVYWATGELYGEMLTEDMWDFGEYNFTIFGTEIARRSSLITQPIGKAVASANRLAAMHTYKQGTMRQGGPADVMFRRIVVPDDYVPGIANNPYDFSNMACEVWKYEDGSNPYYPKGVCMDTPTNMSATVPDTCTDSETGGDIACPSVDFTSSTYGIGDTNPILQGLVQGEGNTMKVLTWHQCPSDGNQIAGDISAVTCDTDDRTDEFATLLDQSWYNPLDVSKGHRGFIDGDMVMFMYAYSPNWRLNKVGHDRYELYVRRSFDGGQTWTTTPQTFLASDGVTYNLGDGTVTCDTYRSTDTGGGDLEEPKVCYEFPAGGAEHARNVTQMQAMRITTLDPRFSPTAASITESCLDGILPDLVDSLWTCDDTSEMDSDVRDPSRYFMVFETGDNTTVEAGEAEPMDLNYSRAVNFGDDYVVWAEETDLSVCYPSDDHGDDKVSDVVVGTGFCNEFDRMNAAGDTHSSEADVESNPDGSKMYGVWAQWVFGDPEDLEDRKKGNTDDDDDDDDAEEEHVVVESDAVARRIWWIEDYIPSDAWEALVGGGTGDGVPAVQ